MRKRAEMFRVHRAVVPAALLTGAALVSIAPAQAETPIGPQASETQVNANSGIASGSADLNNLACGTIWRPVCFPDGLPH
ncbi:hypothetical protein [Nocardia nova]|uniref:hypothetical protein n=1 Tax=Nocardia nova TaxID=37330 RepID=UPI0011B0B970